MALYPDRHSAALPALAAAQRLHGWCSPRGDRAGRLRDARDARLPGVGRDLLRHVRDRAGGRAPRLRVHEHLLLAARRRRALRGDRRRPPASDADINVRAFECLGACDIAPMASVDGVYVRPARRSTTCRSCSTTCAPGARRCPTSSSPAGSSPTRAPTRASSPSTPCRRPRPAARPRERPGPAHAAVRRHRRAGPGDARRSTSAAAATSRCARRWR